MSNSPRYHRGAAAISRRLCELMGNEAPNIKQTYQWIAARKITVGKTGGVLIASDKSLLADLKRAAQPAAQQDKGRYFAKADGVSSSQNRTTRPHLTRNDAHSAATAPARASEPKS